MRFQFSLRTLLAVVTVAAFACAWLTHEARVVKERKAMRERIEYVEGRLSDEDYKNYSIAEEPSFIRQLMGDRKVSAIHFPQTEISDDDARRIKACFPGAALVFGPELHNAYSPGSEFPIIISPFPNLTPGFAAAD
jgi:hypothetical protein